MKKQAVIVLVDVNCKWNEDPPRYRCYINDELFTERTWVWKDAYLIERLILHTEPGTYQIRYELVDPENAKLRVNNFRIKEGPATVDEKGCIQVENA